MLTCINVLYVVFATLCIAANEVFQLTNLDEKVGKLRIFDFLPYLVLVAILIHSICKIK